MAIVTAYTPFAAYAPVFDATSFSFVYGTATSFTPTYIRTEDGARAQEYFGTDFTRDTAGHVVAGTLTQTKYWVDGVLQYTIDGLAHSASAVAGFNPAQAPAGGLLYFIFDGDDTFTGSSGNDLVDGWFGNNTLDGGTGIDTAAYMLGVEDYGITKIASGYRVTKLIGPSQTDTLMNIERAQFLDWGLALDLDPGQAAANTVRVIGAAFDAPAIQQHRDWVGIGLRLFDEGLTLPQVCEFVAQQVLRMDNETFVTTVYANVTGAAPSASERDHYVGMLQGSGGTMTQGQLLEFAANCEANTANVDLVGLQQTGVEFDWPPLG